MAQIEAMAQVLGRQGDIYVAAKPGQGYFPEASEGEFAKNYYTRRCDFRQQGQAMGGPKAVGK